MALAQGAPDRALDRFAALYGIALRLGTVGLGAIAALLNLAPPASLTWLLPAIFLLSLWCLAFLSVAVRRGLTHRLVIADSLIICAALLLQGHLVPAAEIPNSSAWLMPIATAAVLLAQLRLRPPIGIPLGLLVSAAQVAGQARAMPLRPGMLTGAGILMIQTGLAAATVQLVRRAGRAAELECEAQSVQEQESQLAAVRRADEREHFRRLHDTALATLTMVGSGSVRSGSATLHTRAAFDALALRALSPGQPAIGVPERLDTRLRAVVDTEAAGLDVALSLSPIHIRGDALAAIAACVGEALRNIARHAGVDAASINAGIDGSGLVRIEVRDLGRGFDPLTVDTHRRGLRESIVSRMADIGGVAAVQSGPTEGTRIILRWRDDEQHR